MNSLPTLRSISVSLACLVFRAAWVSRAVSASRAVSVSQKMHEAKQGSREARATGALQCYRQATCGSEVCVDFSGCETCWSGLTTWNPHRASRFRIGHRCAP